MRWPLVFARPRLAARPVTAEDQAGTLLLIAFSGTQPEHELSGGKGSTVRGTFASPADSSVPVGQLDGSQGAGELAVLQEDVLAGEGVGSEDVAQRCIVT